MEKSNVALLIKAAIPLHPSFPLYFFQILLHRLKENKSFIALKGRGKSQNERKRLLSSICWLSSELHQKSF
ncbi:hypothetical protein KFK09_012927 [Dendrobium nobile]|uniref:Uncharacterized protein n=1 Tax=Dendrobium nobile TaxID=94219 RepID=A0A8T3BM77_DENNO|nr:hypothetical protein KFK09_012927 [Dendrobium nobile]